MGDIEEAGGKRRRSYGWQDPRRVSEGIRDLPGLEYLRRFIAEGRMAPIQETLGFMLDEVSEVGSTWSLTPEEWHYNPAGSVQGGVYAALLDAAMAVAIWSTLPAGTGWTTVEMKISILRPMSVDTGRVVCRSSLIHCSRRVGTAEGRIADAQGRLMAHGTTTCLILRPD